MKPKRDPKTGQFVSRKSSKSKGRKASTAGSRATVGRTYTTKKQRIVIRTADGVVTFYGHKAVGKKTAKGKKRSGVSTFTGKWPKPKASKPRKRRGNAAGPSVLGEYDYWTVMGR